MTALPRQRAAKLLEQAQLHLSRGEAARAVELAREVAEHADFKVSSPWALWGDALLSSGQGAEAVAAYREGLGRFPKDVELTARLAIALARLERLDEAMPLFERVKKAREREPVFLTQYAVALSQRRQLEEAERLAVRAVSLGGGAEAKLALGVIRGRRGQYADAEKLLQEVERTAKSEALAAAAKGARADARLLQGDAAEALSLWKVLQASGRLLPEQLAHAAYAAEVCGEPERADRWMAERSSKGPCAEDLLLFAQISNLRARPEEALERLDAAERAGGERPPAYAFEARATRGRALRLLGRGEEARRELEALASTPEAAAARLGPQVLIDLGHLDANAARYDAAAERFRAALALDPEEPEAKLALELTARHTSFQAERASSAQAGRAELEAMQRRFAAREGELGELKKELERVAEQKRQAEKKAREAEGRAREAAEQARAAEAASGRRVHEELAQREAEVDEKTRENIERAVGSVRAQVPASILEAIQVAERTFQKSLYTELPAAAVAVLYTGALERALYTLFVERFRVWLDEGGRRASFLEGAIRERRGTRVEYFDHFVEAFDVERPGRAPSMGEVGRVLERRNESYLAPFRAFLSGAYPAPSAFYDELARFVAWSKEGIRDPVAHGRMDEVGYAELKAFREQFLFDLGGAKRGALAGLFGP